MEAKEEFHRLRDEIDRIDREILLLLLKRRNVTKRIGDVKRVLNYPIYDADRERELMERLRVIVEDCCAVDGEDRNGAYESVVGVFREILAASRRVQEGR